MRSVLWAYWWPEELRSVENKYTKTLKRKRASKRILRSLLSTCKRQVIFWLPCIFQVLTTEREQGESRIASRNSYSEKWKGGGGREEERERRREGERNKLKIQWRKPREISQLLAINSLSSHSGYLLLYISKAQPPRREAPFTKPSVTLVRAPTPRWHRA